jgi:hypothetical protein
MKALLAGAAALMLTATAAQAAEPDAIETFKTACLVNKGRAADLDKLAAAGGWAPTQVDVAQIWPFEITGVKSWKVGGFTVSRADQPRGSMKPALNCAVLGAPHDATFTAKAMKALPGAMPMSKTDEKQIVMVPVTGPGTKAGDGALISIYPNGGLVFAWSQN